MKKNILFGILLFIATSCKNTKMTFDDRQSKINFLLDQWHKDAAETNFESYFNAMTADAVFIGTDATENWNKKEFMKFSKPFFDKGKAWNFVSIERNIYFASDFKTAWFDELMSTQMKICRGSGVLVFKNNMWKIKHYVLSMTIPNEKTDTIISIKSAIEDEIIKNKTKVK